MSASELSEDIGTGVDKDHGGASNELVSGTVTRVVDQGLVVGGDPNGNGTIDALRNNAGVQWHDEGEGRATDDQLAEEVLLGGKCQR